MKNFFKIQLAKLLPPCEKVTELASKSLERRLSLTEKIQMKLHLLNCILCKRYGEQITFLRNAAHRLETENHTHYPLSPEAKNKMKQALKEQAE